MKAIKIFLMIGALLCSAGAMATSVEQSCLNYGKKVMRDNPDMLALLKQANIEPSSVMIERFDGKVGKQSVSTEVTAKINSAQEKLGTIFCLVNNDSPLYFHYFSVEE
ncbi:hypothetical protein I2494_14710 [Budviciaceae bacterium BWR-B9]|uniref:Uncharacterized protein n=1 Tax=Limnobaculum allomyrinae TaxID=2791986 RepID=A0ABS1ITC6_9GAMM|nr:MULTISPECIES: hypothetical protein [Limnobaculum]MBK5144947.1 hypothetical protein [Limnobaculum allomyrinae]MBV7692778.1 hypothetical protein [Limnobaculum sp. M2-1]